MFKYKKDFQNRRFKQYVGGFKQAGFTFLEIVISLLVISVGAVSMLQTINVAMDTQYRAVQEIAASNLAAALQSEIICKDFEEVPGSSSTYLGHEGEARIPSGAGPAFDDVDDYNNYADSPPITLGNLAMNGATGLPNYNGFSRSVSVEFVNYNNGTQEYDNSAGFTVAKRITVAVNGPGVINFQLPPIIKEQP